MTNIEQIAQTFYDRHVKVISTLEELTKELSDIRLIKKIVLNDEYDEFKQSCMEIDGFTEMAEKYEKFGSLLVILLTEECDE